MTPDQAQRALLQAARSFPSLPFAGRGDSSGLGHTFAIHPEFWVFAEITEQPSRDAVDPDNDFPGYSWEQRVPQPFGEWAAADTDTEGGLSGDNGSTSGVVNHPAFAIDGDESIAVGTIVVLVRGYQHGGGETDDDEGQEWLILGAGGGTGSLSLVRTSGRPWCLPGLPRIYPAAVRLNNAADLGYHAGDAVWLVQADDDPLDTRGAVTYAATLKHRDYTVETDAGPVTHDLYVTTGRISLADVECNPDGSLRRKFTGEFEGCQNDDSMAFEGEMVLFAGEGVKLE
jgi:hypothetical protein